MRNPKLFDGLILVVLGLVLLLNTLGVISWSIWSALWRYWPVLLVLAGVSLIFRRRIPFMGLIVAGLVISLVAAVVFFPVQFGNLNWNVGSVQRAHFGADLAPGAAGKTLHAILNIGAADVRIAGTTAQAYESDIDYYNRVVPTASYTDAPAEGPRVELSSPNRTGNISTKAENWALKFNPDLPLDLDINAGACTARLDLSAFDVRKLSASNGAGDLDFTIGSRSLNCSIDIATAAAKVTIRVPANAGVRVKYSSVITSNNFSSAGLTRQGDYWVTSGFDTATQKVEVDFSGAVGSINIVR